MKWILVLVVMCASIGLNKGQEDGYIPKWLRFTSQFTVNVQIREPSGILVWTRDSPLIDSFLLELYVGRNNHSERSERDIVWSRPFVANTSVSVDGKFMIANHDMVIEKGETIKYKFSILHNGTLSHSNYRRMQVTDELFHRPKDNICESQCMVNARQVSHEETSRLKTILEKKILECVGPQASEHLYFPLENAENLVADTNLFVTHRLWQIEGLRPIVKNVVTTYLAQNGVGVKMQTAIDKFKVLELGEGKLDMVDFDSILHQSTNYDTTGISQIQ